jgi:2-methylcitrate dehydratase
MAYLVNSLADFVVKASFEMLSKAAVQQLKIRTLDALGCAIGALNSEPVRAIKQQLKDFDGSSHCRLIGGGKASPDRAAFFNGTLIRYLDFNDSYLAKGETCHPSDNISAVLSASEYANKDGRDYLTALAVAYQVQCRLSDVAPVRAKGFDHTTQGAYAVAASVSRALGLTASQTANAIAISGTSYNSLRVTRTGALSNWKGLAYPNTALGATHATFLAMRGITGPQEVFEGNKGFMDSIAGQFEIDWRKEDLERVTKTIVKKYNAEIHSQATIEGALELKEQHQLKPEDIDHINIETFDVAYNIIGGGEEGDKTQVATKEEADHSLPYLVAVALLDGQVMPEQYLPGRIQKSDVQELLRKINIRPSTFYSQHFPKEMPCRISIILHNGKEFSREKKDYEGFITRPITWDQIVRKFKKLIDPHITDSLQKEIIATVKNLERIRIKDLTRLFSKIGKN